MATSIRTHFVAGNENELASRKRPPQSVTSGCGGSGLLANLWELVKTRGVPAQDADEARSLEKRGAGSVQRIPACWSEVISDPVLWKELREIVLDGADDYAA
jgi:hypothetical protein